MEKYKLAVSSADFNCSVEQNGPCCKCEADHRDAAHNRPTSELHQAAVEISDVQPGFRSSSRCLAATSDSVTTEVLQEHLQGGGPGRLPQLSSRTEGGPHGDVSDRFPNMWVSSEDVRSDSLQKRKTMQK